LSVTICAVWVIPKDRKPLYLLLAFILHIYIFLENVPIFLADVKDEESLRKITKQARVLINCCGPYTLYGEPVVKACIATRTHYVDVSGEEYFMMEMQLKYNEAAKEAGIYVVSSCGFECLLSDLGILFTQEKFGGEVNDVDIYMKTWLTNTDNKGPYLNCGSWESMIYIVAYANKLPTLRNKLYPTKLPKFTPKLKSRGLVHRSDVSEGWSVPLRYSSDGPLALRTQRFLYDKYKQRPVQVQLYATFTSLYNLVKFFLMGIIFWLMTRTGYSRELLLKHPSLFTLGYITHEQPHPEAWKSMQFSVTIKARGWTEELTEPTDKHTNPPNKTVITKVSGVSPAYEATSIIAILSAITILNETDKMPDNGGVLTPGAAFGKTSLIEQMNKHNIKFEVISSTVK
ncbi:PREDICTED: saccharopine dehydrogenase-like oxidoreductase, partial [Vollenhovia emeryi]|uniref:saccharopine dehydrogenase-like oxidoreductase n=1 Tax=Vollenhovia emeryi TaxID=411798 RepID=UPI0005F4BD6F